MASIFAYESRYEGHRSKYLSACFTVIAGGQPVRLRRSTKLVARNRADRKLAMRVADELEEVGQGRRTPAEMREFLDRVDDLRARAHLGKVFDEVYELAHGAPVARRSVRWCVETWLDRRRVEVRVSTLVAYKGALDRFLESLGPKAGGDIREVTAEDVRAFRDGLAARLSASTARHNLKMVKVFFREAWRDGHAESDVASRVQLPKVDGGAGARERGSQPRQGFTREELGKVFAACEGEWRGLFLFGLYTGQRLGDVVRLRWGQIDEAGEAVRLRTLKTGREVSVPLAPRLRALTDRNLLLVLPRPSQLTGICF